MDSVSNSSPKIHSVRSASHVLAGRTASPSNLPARLRRLWHGRRCVKNTREAPSFTQRSIQPKMARTALALLLASRAAALVPTLRTTSISKTISRVSYLSEVEDADKKKKWWDQVRDSASFSEVF